MGGRIRHKGFTIIEILIVVAVIGIIAAITIVSYGAVANNANNTAVQSDLKKIDDQFKLFALDNAGQFPDTTQELASLNIESNGDVYFRNDAANLYVCVNHTRTEYAVIAKSKSGKRYVVQSEGGLKEYAGNVIWDSATGNWGDTCASIDPTYIPAPGNLSGMRDGEWVAWTGTAEVIECPTGFIIVPGNSMFGTEDFCVMKYEAKDVGGVATSQASGTPWVSISQPNAVIAAQAACTGCHLITEAEWLTLAHNVLNVGSNWSGGSVGSGFIYSGHNDGVPNNALAGSTDNDGYSGTGQTAGSNQRRTLNLNNGEVIWDLAGNVWEWTPSTLPLDQQPGLVGDSGNSWKEYNNPSLIMGGLSSTALPAYGTPAAASWSSSQGIGMLYSNRNASNNDRTFARGGRWANAANAGVFALSLADSTSTATANLGFRVAK